MRILRPALLTLVVSTLLLPAVASAQSSWAVAQRDDEALASLVDKLTPHASTAPGADGAAAVVLYDQYFYEMQEKGYKLCHNLIFLVQDPAELGDDLTAGWVDPSQEIEETAAFVLRDGQVQRLGQEAMPVEAGDGEIRRGKAAFAFEGLKSGDVVGWSVVSRSTNPLFLERIAAARSEPVVYSSLRIINDGDSNFEVRGRGLGEQELPVKTEGLVNDRPREWKVSLKNLEPLPDLPATSPYPLGTPLYEIVLTEARVDIQNMYTGWVPTVGRASTATLLSNLKQQMLKQAGGVEITASALTAGLAGDQEKEEALFAYVKEKIATLDGPGYERGGARDPKQILSAKEATPQEKSVLLLALMDAAGLPCEFGLVRPQAWGPLDESDGSLGAFHGLVVRAGGKTPRFYDPACEACAPGALPAADGEAQVFSPKPGLLEEAQKYNETVRTKAFAESGGLDVRRLQMQVEEHARKEGWYRVEMVGGAGS